MTWGELCTARDINKNADKSILVSDNKNRNKPACLVMSQDQYKDLKRTSELHYIFLGRSASVMDKAFPSLAPGGGDLTSTLLSTLCSGILSKK